MNRSPWLEWLLPLGAAAACTALLLGVSAPGLWFGPAFVGFFGVLVLGALWLVRVIAAVTGPRSQRLLGGDGPRPGRANAVAAMVVVPAVVVVTGALVVAGVPADVRFEGSRSAFAEVAAGDLVVEPPGDGVSIGSYTIVRIVRFGDAVVFTDSAGGMASGGGFAYLPDGPASGVMDEGFEEPTWVALGDGWYRWSAPW